MNHGTKPTLKLFTTLAAIVVVIGFVALPGAGAAGDPTDPWSDQEVLLVYELNRARWNPNELAVAAGVDPTTILPRPPLAPNLLLAVSAGFRSDEMAEHAYLAHQSAVTGMWPNEVVRSFGYELPAEWGDDYNFIESVNAGSPDPLSVVGSFIPSPSHMVHIMGQEWFSTHLEIGVGMHPDTPIWTIHTAYREDADRFLTGVVYDDLNGNDRLDLGEGLPGVEVRVGTRRTFTTAGGAWSMSVARGLHQVSARGGDFSGASAAMVRINRFNVQVDFVSGVRTPQVFAYDLCRGQEPTILGTSGDDVIYGTPDADVIHGFSGNDLIYGLEGDDVICGGNGNDVISGDAGRDVLVGGSGDDQLTGSYGADTLFGQRGEDRASGGRSDDRLNGGIGSDELRGGEGSDLAIGGSGDDACFGSEHIRACTEG
jgi:hypothetical protein